MKTSYKWIKSLVPGLNASSREYMDALTLSGTKVEFFEQLDANLDKIVIGKIQSVDPHPDADKLVICQVDVGTEVIQIVTGAPNVFPGAVVPVVLDGGRVAGSHKDGSKEGGVKIKKGKLRGVESNGMMCSIDELGADIDLYPEADPDGIYIIDKELTPGEDAIPYFGLDDTLFEYEITSNRIDCYSVIGIAREAAATFKCDFKEPVVRKTGNSENVEDYVSVKIEDPNYCKRYTARVVKNVKIAPSPDWMKERLRAHGIRPINNLVDITNYVMVEYGQPMHAYDLATIADAKIIVKNAKAGETFTTLDGQERPLDEEVVMICDGKKPVGIGGIMGGENSMITDDVQTVLFEAACFYGANIRKSSKRIGLRTEASSYFEKGLDPNNALLAVNRACELMEELGAGEVVGGVIDEYPVKQESYTLPFEPERYNKLLGTDLSEETMLSDLQRLGLIFDKEKNELLIPTWRMDLESYADLAEEVARLYGYDKIPTTLPRSESTMGGRNFKMGVECTIETALKANGFSQAYVYSFESPKVFDKLMLPEDDKRRNAVEISNPLGEDFSIMRTLSENGILTSLGTNYGRRNKNVRLFEIGNIYIPKALPLTELPDEKKTVTFAMYGDGDFFDLKGVVLNVLESIGMHKKPRLETDGGQPYLHPGRQAKIRYGKGYIGYMGEVHPLVAAAYGIKQSERVYLAVLDIDEMLKTATFDRKYKGLARFPAATRDLSLVVPKEVTAGQLEDIFNGKGGNYLESYELFDVYEGAQVLTGHKSMAYSLIFRAPDRNLAEEDITAALDRILKALEKIGVTLRS